ncbi:MAG: DMT family transporter [Actinomycetota bacterium]|nr:DMT family transporter [Actinomycetota bacterium]
MSVIAAPAAALAATMIGASGVAQRRAALVVPPFAPGDPRLLRTLARAPWWWVGTAAATTGLAFQVLALATGPLLLVQGILVASVVASTAGERLVLGRRPTRGALSGVALTVVGLVGVLVVLAPAGGDGPGPSAAESLAVGGGSALLMLATVGWARTVASRAWAIAASTGIGYGVVAVMLKQVGLQLSAGLTAPLGHPALYVAVALGGWCVLLSQNALQRGSGAVAVVTPILVLDPIVGLVAGQLWFSERITTTPDALTVAGAATALLLVGMALTEAGGRHAVRAATPGRGAARTESMSSTNRWY